MGRCRANPSVSYALDFVVERKAVKDLVGSIKNGRYERQKYVMQRCGLRRVMYLVEGNPDVEVQGVSCPAPKLYMCPVCKEGRCSCMAGSAGAAFQQPQHHIHTWPFATGRRVASTLLSH